MSVTIFKIKILEETSEFIEEEKLINYCFSSPKRHFKFSGYLKFFGVDLSKEENLRGMSYKRFLTLLEENRDLLSLQTLSNLKEIELSKREVLKESYNARLIKELIAPKTLIWNNILASLKIEGFTKYPVTKIVMEIVQDQDGIAAFPNHRGLGINSPIYREFMLRALSEIENQSQAGSTQFNDWINANEIELHPEYPRNIDFSQFENGVGIEGIIWGIKEENEIVIELDDIDYIKKYKDAWWLERIKSNFEYWKENSSEWAEVNKEYPFRIKTFSLILHPAWFNKNLNSTYLDEIYDSTAYAY